MAKAPRQTTRNLRAKKAAAGEDPIERKLDVENKELALAKGTVTKDKVYYKKLEAVIESKREHPKHHNVRMQAHHIISEKSVKMAGKEYIDELLLLGYNINDLENLAFIPSTLQGACHLGIQPHIGNHSANILAEFREGDARSYDDDDHPYDYHNMVKRKLSEVLAKLKKECPSTHPDAPARAKKRINALSAEVLGMIASNPHSAPLSNAYKAFSDDSKIGCGGALAIKKSQFLAAVLPECPVHRNHFNNQQADGQKPEGITYPKVKKYLLIQGN